MPLLWHSDYNGVFSPRECKNIAHGLNDILQNIKTYSKNKLSTVLLSNVFTFATLKKKLNKQSILKNNELVSTLPTR